jgi:hypothetical protein
VNSYCGLCMPQRVGNSYGKCGRHPRRHFFGGEPCDLGRFGGGLCRAGSDVATENQGDDIELEVLVGAAEIAGLDDDAGLLLDLPDESLLHGLARFEYATGGLPMAVVPALDGKDPTVLSDDDSGDADGPRMFRRLVGPPQSDRLAFSIQGWWASMKESPGWLRQRWHVQCRFGSGTFEA